MTAIDGYKIARKGRAGPALAISTLVIAVAAPLLSAFALKFGPADYFSLIVFGLICYVTLAHGSVLNAVAMIVLGILLSLIGTDIYTDAARFTFGYLPLGLAEVLRNLEMQHGGSASTWSAPWKVVLREVGY